MTIKVNLGLRSITVARDVFTSLLDDSVVATRAPYRHALDLGEINFDQLVALSRVAQIPYSLFFAPMEVVRSQLERKSKILLSGVSKSTFALNTRGAVDLSDVELIVKDILRKQELLKQHDTSLLENTIVGCLSRQAGTVAQDALILLNALDMDSSAVQACKSKEGAFDLLVEIFERKQVLISQSQRNYMPQSIPTRAKFSGICIRDRKIPFIFLTGGDSDDRFEPAGRRVFTLALLGVCVARGLFSPVTYSDQTDSLIGIREYAIAEEFLMPASEVSQLTVRSLDDVKILADRFRVTPTAFLMRARRLNLITDVDWRVHLSSLREEFSGRGASFARSPKPINAIRKYNGSEYSRRILMQLDAGRIAPGEVRRVLFQNKLNPKQISEYRASL